MYKLRMVRRRILIMATILSILVVVVPGCQTAEIKKEPSEGDSVANFPKMVVIIEVIPITIAAIAGVRNWI